MKGVVFTTDAIFAMIIAMAGISILVFFSYSPQEAVAAVHSNPQSILDALFSTRTSMVSSGSTVISQLLSQAGAGGDTWYSAWKDGQNSGSALYGPNSPALSFTFNAGSQITSHVLAGYGNVYFATSQDEIYALNASTGSLVWSYSASPYSPGDLLLYRGLLVFTNTGTDSANMVALSALNGAAAWNTSMSAAVGSESTPKQIYEGKIVFGTSGDIVAAFDPNNGTLAWDTVGLGSEPSSIGVINGSLAVDTATGSLVLLSATGSSVTELWSKSLGISAPSTDLGTVDGAIESGIGVYAVGNYIDGTGAFSRWIGGTASGMAGSSSTLVYQTANNVVAIPSSCTGQCSILWGTNMNYGSGFGYRPAISGSTVYTEWGGGYLVAQNISNGAVEWAAKIPFSTLGPITVAYGRAYLGAGDQLLAYGGCDTRPGSALIESLTSLYLNGGGSCAEYLLDSVYKSSNFSVFINGTYAPGMHAAYFNGADAWISLPEPSNLPTGDIVSVTAWVKPGVQTSGCGAYCGIIAYGGRACSGTSMLLSMQSNYLPSMATWCNDYVPTSGPALVKGQWNFVAAVVDISQATLYVNGKSENGILPQQPDIVPGPLSIGCTDNLPSRCFNGSIADVQVYGAALSQQQYYQLYAEGLGGAPLQGEQLSAWWPLAGDANSYYNANDSGYAMDVNYPTTGYTPPQLRSAYEVSGASAIVPASFLAAQFDGLTGSQISVPGVQTAYGSHYTLSLWVNINNTGTEQFFANSYAASGGVFALGISPGGGVCLDIGGSCSSTESLGQSKWYLYSASFNGSDGIATTYIDGKEISAVSASAPSVGGIAQIGTFSTGYLNANAEISNVQYYNETLNQSQVSQLYSEGVSGIPVNGISGWWPLNGNPSDYIGGTGIRADGIASNVVYGEVPQLYDIGVYAWH